MMTCFSQPSRPKAKVFANNIWYKSERYMWQQAEPTVQVLGYQDEYMCLYIKCYLQHHTIHYEKCLL